MYLVTIFDGPNDKTGTVIHSPYPHSRVKLTVGSGTLVAKGISDFSFTLNLNNPGWGKIKHLKTLITIQDLLRSKTIFKGRVLKPSEKMASSGAFSSSYDCEDELAYLHDSNQRYGEYHNMTVKDFFTKIIQNHNSQVEVYKRFKVGNVTVTDPNNSLYRYLGYDKTFETIQTKLIDSLGGYLQLRYEADGTYIDYLSEVGAVSNTPIRLRKNLKEMQREIDPTGIVTRLVPLGAKIESEDESAADAPQARLTIASVNDALDYIDDDGLIAVFGVIEGKIELDDVTEPSKLLLRGRQFLAEQKGTKISYALTATDVSLIDSSFDELECKNWYTVENPVFGISELLQVVEKNFDVVEPQKVNLTIGEKYKTLTQYQAYLNKKSRSVEKLELQIASQLQTINSLRTEINGINTAVGNINQTLTDNDIPALEQAVEDLQTAVNSLNDSIDGIPEYQLATETSDGLMAAADKTKTNLITVVNPVDLDDLVARITTLEGGTA